MCFSLLPSSPLLLSGNINATSGLVEQLFLDLCVQDILNNTAGMNLVEPWATKYVESLRDRRYGDAIWARYHIGGDMGEGIIDDGSGNMTVIEAIEEDARGYRVNDPALYASALSFYAQTSNEDSHASDVLALIRRIGEEDDTELERDLEKRKTFGISCSRNNLAYENACYYLLRYMGESRAFIGDTRSVYSYGNCYLRVGPMLIIQECDFVPACCSYTAVSGYSPKNSGHRTICLSSKRLGCS
ncbi:hypothetical protein BJX63DRAFT_445135 [Aspergillus granulosus]|uniref:Uncharacterized protein n=1 Tax=Aspergillus granulosus TaxID=176169 RepID=A0ABR4H2S7_9EURO